MLNPQPSAGNPTSWFLTNSGEAHLALTSKSVIMMKMMILHTSRCAVEVRPQLFHSWLRVQWTTDPPGAASAMEVRGASFLPGPVRSFPQQGACYKHMTFLGSEDNPEEFKMALPLLLTFTSPSGPPELPTSTSYQMQTSCSDSWKAARPPLTLRCIGWFPPVSPVPVHHSTEGFQPQSMAAASDVRDHWWRAHARRSK